MGVIAYVYAPKTPQSDATTSEAVQAMPVTTTTLEPVMGYQVQRTYTGEIVSRQKSHLGFEQGGTIVALSVDQGDRLITGQLLAKLDTRSLEMQRQELQAQRLQAQALLSELKNGARVEDIAAARAAIADLEHQIQLSSLKTQRREELYNAGAISRESYDQERFSTASLQSRLDLARSNLEKLLNGSRPEQISAQVARVQQLDASIAQIDIQLSKSWLYAPFSGIVGDRLVEPGMVVGSGATILTVIEDQLPEAHIGLPPEITQTLSVGSKHTVQVNDDSYEATLEAFLPELEGDNQTVTAIFQLKMSDLNLRSGQTARLALAQTQATQGFWLPSTALVPAEHGLWSVYTLGTAEQDSLTYTVARHDVEVLYSEGDRSFVRGTVQPGDRIITSGTHRIVLGQTVKVTP